ncbi:hypothetical protein ENBRE01_1452 [Enteropsectra breve]|nr:hypothetical protein ENBRE01_1452 [Enteropsectra breve]
MVYIAGLQMYSVQSIKQFFVSSANFIIDRSKFFTDKGELLFSTGTLLGPLTMGLLSLCPVIMMLNENLNKCKALEDKNSESKNTKTPKFTRYYSYFLMLIALLCPLLTSVEDLRNFFFRFVIITRFAESFILYPLSVFISSLARQVKVLRSVSMLIIAAASLILAYSAYESVLYCFGIAPTVDSLLSNDTTTFATPVAQ